VCRIRVEEEGRCRDLACRITTRTLDVHHDLVEEKRIRKEEEEE
jgi:hypothetical protein